MVAVVICYLLFRHKKVNIEIYNNKYVVTMKRISILSVLIF